VTLAIAFGVACAAICSGMAWSAGRRKLAVAIVVLIVAGEAYGLIATAERLIVSRPKRRCARVNNPDGEVDLLTLRDKYGVWCPAERRVPGPKIGRALADQNPDR
jgi:hypothetical protein